MKQTRKGIVMRMLYIQRKFEQTPLTTIPWLLKICTSKQLKCELSEKMDKANSQEKGGELQA
jgi:hypothetical protein